MKCQMPQCEAGAGFELRWDDSPNRPRLLPVAVCHQHGTELLKGSYSPARVIRLKGSYFPTTTTTRRPIT